MTTRVIAYDCDLDQPGCVMVAAGLCADTAIPQLFETSSWIVSLTPGMRRYEVTDEQLALLVERVNARHKQGATP